MKKFFSKLQALWVFIVLLFFTDKSKRLKILYDVQEKANSFSTVVPSTDNVIDKVKKFKGRS